MTSQKVIRDDVREMSSYVVPKAEGLLKLDAMESPETIPEQLKAEWLERLERSELNRYPDASVSECSARLKEILGLGDAFDVMWGNGSDELIQILIQSVADDDAVVMAPQPSFVMYNLVTQWNRVRFVGVDLTEDFQLDRSRWIEAIKREQPKLVFLAQPNNPTGNLFDDDTVRAIIDAAPGLVVIDEAYSAYSSRDHLKLLDEHENVVILRTLSKEGFAGIRLGYLIAACGWVNELDKLRMPYNINTLTQLTAGLLLENYDLIAERAAGIIEARSRLVFQLEALDLEVFPSEANFVVIRASCAASQLLEAMKQRGVLVKSLCGSHPLLNRCLRITVSNAGDNEIMLAALKASLGDVSA